MENVTFFVCVVFFLLERDRKRKNYECDCLGKPIPYKTMFCRPSSSSDQSTSGSTSGGNVGGLGGCCRGTTGSRSRSNSTTASRITRCCAGS